MYIYYLGLTRKEQNAFIFIIYFIFLIYFLKTMAKNKKKIVFNEDDRK